MLKHIKIIVSFIIEKSVLFSKYRMCRKIKNNQKKNGNFLFAKFRVVKNIKKVELCQISGTFFINFYKIFLKILKKNSVYD